jgi:parallel beta-helix repeat protein
LVTKNYVHNVPAELCQGILVHDSASDIEVSYNTISNSKGGGIYVFERSDGTAKTAKNVWVHHNTLNSVYTDGISLYPEGSINKCQYCVVEYNTLTDCGNSGRHTALAVGWGGNSGATATLGCDYNTIRGNTVIRSAYTIGGYLNIRGDHNLITGNTIKNAQFSPIRLLRADYNTVEDNLIQGVTLTSGDALRITWSSYNTIKNNQLLDPNRNGVCIERSSYGGSSYNTLSGNTIYSPRLSCIAIYDSSCVGNKITGNLFKNPSSSYPTGIYNAGKSTTISGNSIVRV